MNEIMNEIMKDAERLLSIADSGSDDCEIYGKGFTDGVKYVINNVNIESFLKAKESISLEWLKASIDAISEARLIMEDFDDSGAMTVGYDKNTYILNKNQMLKIATALYLSDVLISL